LKDSGTMKILDNSLLDPLMRENDEIIAIIVASIKTSRKNDAHVKSPFYMD